MLVTSSSSHLHVNHHVNCYGNIPCRHESRIPLRARADPGNSHAQISNWTIIPHVSMCPNTLLPSVRYYEPPFLSVSMPYLRVLHCGCVSRHLCTNPTCCGRSTGLYQLYRQTWPRYNSCKTSPQQENKGWHHHHERCPHQGLPWRRFSRGTCCLPTTAPLQTKHCLCWHVWVVHTALQNDDGRRSLCKS